MLPLPPRCLRCDLRNLLRLPQNIERRLIGRPVLTFVRLEQSVRDLRRCFRIERGEPLPHRGIEHVGAGELLVDPRRHLSGGRRPAERIGDLRLDLPDALVAVRQKRLVPFRIERPRARFERDLLGECPHRAVTARLVPDIDGRASAACAAHRTADAAERVEIVIDGGDAELDRIEILIGDIHARENMREQGILPGEAAAHAVGKTFAAHIGLGQFILVVPAAMIDKLIDIGAVGAIGIAEYAKRGLSHVAAMLRLVSQRVLAHAILFAGFLGAGGKQRRFGQSLVWSGSRSRKMPDSVITTSTRARPRRSSGTNCAPARRP